MTTETAPTLGVIRVLTSNDPELVTAHGRVCEDAFGVRTISRCLPGQPHGVHDTATHDAAVPKVVEAARRLAADGADAVVLSCAADPGLAGAREAVQVPVAGAGSAAAGTALALGRRVGVLGITEDVPDAVADVLGGRLAAARVPEGVSRTTELYSPGGFDAALDATGALVDAGAKVIVLACTGLTTIGLAPAIRRRYGVHAVDPVLAAGSLAVSLAFAASMPPPFSTSTTSERSR